MTAAGMDVARFNFSHGSHDFHRRVIDEVRLVSAEQGRRVDLMQDLQGPKLRIGRCLEALSTWLKARLSNCARAAAPRGNLPSRYRIGRW